MSVEVQFGMPPAFAGGGDRYKIDYSAVAAKSRCVAGNVNIACIINSLRWSGREDSNLRPSAPKADALPGCATPRHSSIVARIGIPLEVTIWTSVESYLQPGVVKWAPVG